KISGLSVHQVVCIEMGHSRQQVLKMSKKELCDAILTHIAKTEKADSTTLANAKKSLGDLEHLDFDQDLSLMVIATIADSITQFISHEDIRKKIEHTISCLSLIEHAVGDRKLSKEELSKHILEIVAYTERQSDQSENTITLNKMNVMRMSRDKADVQRD